MQGRELLKKYVGKRMVKNALLCFGIAVPVAILCLVFALMSDKLAFDLLLPLIPLVIAALVFAISLIPLMQFKQMIRKQEDLYIVSFGNAQLEPIEPESRFYSSDEWFVCAGSWAMFRGFVAMVSEKHKHTAKGVNYIARVMTVDGKKYGFPVDAVAMKQLRRWMKT